MKKKEYEIPEVNEIVLITQSATMVTGSEPDTPIED